MIITENRDLLVRLGLADLHQVRRFQGKLVKNHRGRRDILTITTEQDGRPLVLFLKRNWKPYRKDGLATLLRHGRVRSASRQEWENCRTLAAAGLRTAEVLAYGEDCGLLWERFSFILTRAADGSRTLEEFLRTCGDRALRRTVLAALAANIKRMHDAGLSTPDLFARHIFVDTDNRHEPRFCLIDMARLERQSYVSVRRRARDLAALNISVPLRDVSAAERLRFLRAYAGTVDGRLFRLIRRRMNHLLSRAKFRPFLQPRENTAPASPAPVAAHG